MKAYTVVLSLLVNILFISQAALSGTPPTTTTYQGVLELEGQRVNGTFDLEFDLFDAESDGQSLALQVVSDYAVIDGLVNVELDFGGVFDSGSATWLEIRVSGAGESEIITLDPRQAITGTPFAFAAAAVGFAGVDSLAIVDESISSADLGADSVGTSEIVDQSVAEADLGPDSVGAAQIQAGAVDTLQIAEEGVQTNNIKGRAVTGDKIALGTVGAQEANPFEIQVRVTGTCPPGQYIRSINGLGFVVCETDSDTTGLTTVSRSIVRRAFSLNGNPGPGGDFVVWSRFTNEMCFLIEFETVNGGPAESACRVVESTATNNPVWNLVAESEPGSSAQCAARCISWN